MKYWVRVSTGESNSENQGFFRFRRILDAIDPYRCVLWEEEVRYSGVNRTCAECHVSLVLDPGLERLHFTSLRLFRFFIALQQKSLSSTFYVVDTYEEGIEEKSGTIIWYTAGNPGTCLRLKKFAGFARQQTSTP